MILVVNQKKRYYYMGHNCCSAMQMYSGITFMPNHTLECTSYTQELES